MTTRPPSRGDFFTIDPSKILEGDSLPFDTFIYLELNDKFLLWIRANTSVTESHLRKCERLAPGTIFVPLSQREQFERYIAEQAAQQNAPVMEDSSDSDFKVFGAIQLKDDSRVVSSHVQIIQSKAGPKGPVQPRLRVDVDFLNCVIISTQSVFKDLLGMNIQSRPPFRRGQKGMVPPSVDVASFVSLVSQTIRGTVGLCFPESTYLYIMRQFRDVDEITPDLFAGSGELMSSIFERARPSLVELGYPLERAVPTLVHGKGLLIGHLISDPGFSLVFDSPGGPFLFEVGIKTGG